MTKPVDLPTRGRLATMLHDCLQAYKGNIDAAIADCEGYSGTSEPLLLALKIAKQRQGRHQFLPRRKRHGS